MSKKAIIVEQNFSAPIKTVWSAITEGDQMTQWFFDNIPDFKAEVSFETQFKVQSGEIIFTHLWKIIEVIPFKKIVHDWTYEEYPGQGFVTFELFEELDETKLRLTNKGLESFPKDIPEFTEESCRGGWNYFIKNRLKEYLKKTTK